MRRIVRAKKPPKSSSSASKCNRLTTGGGAASMGEEDAVQMRQPQDKPNRTPCLSIRCLDNSSQVEVNSKKKTVRLATRAWPSFRSSSSSLSLGRKLTIRRCLSLWYTASSAGHDPGADTRSPHRITHSSTSPKSPPTPSIKLKLNLPLDLTF